MTEQICLRPSFAPEGGGIVYVRVVRDGKLYKQMLVADEGFRVIWEKELKTHKYDKAKLGIE